MGLFQLFAGRNCRRTRSFPWLFLKMPGTSGGSGEPPGGDRGSDGGTVIAGYSGEHSDKDSGDD